jgi:hypothetical protein
MRVNSRRTCSFIALGCCLTLPSYDFFKAELLKTAFFKDDIFCHFTASFAAVRMSITDAARV